MNHKLGICVPYRDTGDGVRKGHLDRLVPHLEKFLGERNIDFRVYVGHQVDDKLFNRSGTKNAAFLAAIEDGCDYVAMHDVDMLPEDDKCDYSYPTDYPRHIACYLSQWDYNLRDVEYFGGVILFTKEQFLDVNGYNPDYWEWGMEDDDLFWRCVKKGYTPKTSIDGPGKTKALYFNGEDDHIIVPPSRSLRNLTSRSFEIEITLNAQLPKQYTEYLIGDLQNRRYIDFPIINRKGWDFNIGYNNSRAFSTTMWTWRNELIYTWAKRYPNKWTKLNLKVDDRNKEVRFLINDKETDSRHGTGAESPLVYENGLKRYGGIPYIIGKAHSSGQVDSKYKHFQGYIQEIKFTDMRDNLVLHYDMSKSVDGNVVKDLSGNQNHGELHGGELRDVDVDKFYDTDVPHRSFGRMNCMYHDDVGIVNNKFTLDTTQKNEELYRLQMQKDKIDINEVGVKQQKYEIVSKEDIYDRHQIINVRF